MQPNLQVIKKLQNAINKKFDEKLLFNQTQWYSEEKNAPVNLYKLKKVIIDPETGRHSNIEIFSTYSHIQMVLFLRDYWYELNGWEVPTDNEEWNKAKASYKEKSNG